MQIFQGNFYLAIEDLFAGIFYFGIAIYFLVYVTPFILIENSVAFADVIGWLLIIPLTLTAFATLWTANKAYSYGRVQALFIATMSGVYGSVFWFGHMFLFGIDSLELVAELSVTEVAPGAFMTGLTCFQLCRARAPNKQSNRTVSLPVL